MQRPVHSAGRGRCAEDSSDFTPVPSRASFLNLIPVDSEAPPGPPPPDLNEFLFNAKKKNPIWPFQ